MTERLLADLVVLLHLGFVLFAALGALLARVWRFAPWLHLPAVAWGVAIEWTGGVCPLTPLENRLRHAAGEAGYTGGFVEHYVVPVVYPPGLSPRAQAGLGVALLVLNVALYALVWRRRDGRGPRRDPPRGGRGPRGDPPRGGRGT